MGYQVICMKNRTRLGKIFDFVLNDRPVLTPKFFLLKALMSELEKREIQVSAVQDRGDALILQHHPASKCVEAYMTALQTQWHWLLQLTLCLETHLRHAAVYHSFFSEVQKCEQWCIM
jgi:hypothetical protein